MTKQELISMMGNEDKANWAMERMLEAIKPEFVIMVLKATADAAKQRVEGREASGYYTEFSEFPEGFNYWSASEELQEQFDKDRDRQIEHDGDRQTAAFTMNMWVHAINHKPTVKD